MRAVRPGIVCDRVRAQVSLAQDGELSQLERRMLAVHLALCADCRAFGADVTAFTRELRLARLEVPEHAVVVRRLRRPAIARLHVAAAAALAIVSLGVASQLAALGGSDAPLVWSGDPVTQFPTLGELQWELAILDSPSPNEPVSAGAAVL